MCQVISFPTVLLNRTFLKMGFMAVRWENENSVSVVNEKKVVGAVELKEGTTVDILTGTNKGRVAIYKATILKVCGGHKLRYSSRDRDLIKE